MIILPTGEKVSTREANGEHYQRILPVKDSPSGPVDISDYKPFPVQHPQAFYDAFSRMRVSTITTLGDFKQVVETHNSLIWSEKLAGGGNSIYVQEAAAQRLQVGTSAGDSVVRQTKRYYRYSPGKSALLMFTALFRTSQNNTVKRIGYFDEANGLFFQQTSTGMAVVVRSSASGTLVDDAVPQHNWNMDTMDGSGKEGVPGTSDGANPSGIQLDHSKAQIHIIDFAWLGLGRVRFGYIIKGKIHYVHEFYHANIVSKVYMSTPNLPIRTELFNTNIAPASATMDQICFAVILEDGIGSDGIRRSADTGATGHTFDGSLTPIIMLRLNSANIRTTLVDVNLEILAGANFRWAAMLNPTLNLTGAGTWNSVASSVAEWNTTQVGTVTDPGLLIHSGYAPSKGSTSDRPLLTLAEDIGIYADIDGTPDMLVIAAQKIGGGSDTAYCSLNWRELV